MAAITEDFCDFEIAKLLKEKGFDAPFQYFYKFDSKELYRVIALTNTQIGDKFYNAPTLQMAMKWLREIHGLFISIGNDDLDYNWQIFDIKNRTKDLDPTCLTDSYAGYRKYEQAVEAAIKYCLENLVY